MDELNITPQPEGDKPEGTPEDNQSTPQPAEGQETQAFDLNNEQKSEAAPSVEEQLLQPSASDEQSAQPTPAPSEEAPTGESTPATVETPSPAEEVEEASAAPEEPTEVPTTEEATTEATSESSVLTQNGAKPHGGIPKWAMIAGGVVGLGAVVVGAMFATDTWPFKGQVAEVIDDVPIIADVSPAAPEYCPDGQYYDPTEDGSQQNRLQLLDDAAIDSGQNNLQLLNAVPSARAQNLEFSNVSAIDSGIAPIETIEADFQPVGAERDDSIMIEGDFAEGSEIDNSMIMLDADLETIGTIESDRPTATIEGDFQNFDSGLEEDAVRAEIVTDAGAPIEVLTATQEDIPEDEGLSINNNLRAPLEVNTSTFDRTRCKPIPEDNCDLLDKMQENPSMYFLSPATEDMLEDWQNENCSEPIIPIVTETVIPTCGENQELEASTNQCVCKPGYFELENASSYDGDSNARISVDDATRAAILDQAGSLTLATNNNAPQNTLTLLDGSSESSGLAINNNLADESTGLRMNQGESTGLEINTNQARLGTDNLSVNRLQQFECINCEQLQARIDTLQGRIEGLDALDITDEQRATQESVLSAEVARLEAKAAQENCSPTIETIIPRTPATPLIPERLEEQSCDELIQEITRIQGYPTTATTPEIAQELAAYVSQAEAQGCELPERDECSVIAESVADYVSQGDFRSSYNEQISYIDRACTGELDSCDSRLAYAVVAREYMNSAELADDIVYFEGEYAARRSNYMDDLGCVPDKQPRCDALESDIAEGFTFRDDGNLYAPNALVVEDVADSDVLSLDLTALDVADAELATRETNLLSQNNMSRLISDSLESKRLLNDKEYYDLYCQPYVPPTISTITPIVPYSGDPINLELPEETPEETVEPPISPAAPTDPVVEDPVAPPPTPVEELAAAAPESDFQAPAAPSPDVVETGETAIEPPAPTPTEEAEVVESPFLAPAAPAEPEVMAQVSPATPTLEEVPEITESPEITKTGPEVYMFFFVIVASQIYYFRRRIYAFIENR